MTHATAGGRKAPVRACAESHVVGRRGGSALGTVAPDTVTGAILPSHRARQGTGKLILWTGSGDRDLGLASGDGGPSVLGGLGSIGGRRVAGALAADAL